MLSDLMCAANCGMWGGGLCVRCKLLFLQYNKYLIHKHGLAVPCRTTWWQCDTQRQESDAISLLVAGYHILTLEEGLGWKHIDLRRLMVCLDFNEYRSSWVMLHDNCVSRVYVNLIFALFVCSCNNGCLIFSRVSCPLSSSLYSGTALSSAL